MKRALVVAGLVAATPAAHAEPLEYRLDADPQVSMRTGTLGMTTLARLALRGEDVVLLRAEEELTPTSSLLTRVAAGLLVDAPIAIAGIVLPHEVFGHGGRAREAGFGVSYDLSPPPPYGWIFGGRVGNSVNWEIGDEPEPTLDETALFALGGLEVQGLQIHDLGFSAFRARTLSRGDALLYLTATIEAAAYTARSSGDIEHYFDHLEARYLADREVERRRTRVSAAIAAVDPLFLVSLYSYFYRYLVRGDRTVPYPAIAAGPLELSARLGLLLVPWGREHELTVLLGASQGNLASTFGVGEGPGGSSLSWSVRAADIRIAGDLFATSRLHVARQPRLGVIDRDEPLPNTGMFGGPRRHTSVAGEVGLDYRIGSWVVGGRIGRKTDGYVPGDPYAASWTGAVTLGVRIQ